MHSNIPWKRHNQNAPKMLRENGKSLAEDCPVKDRDNNTDNNIRVCRFPFMSLFLENTLKLNACVFWCYLLKLINYSLS